MNAMVAASRSFNSLGVPVLLYSPMQCLSTVTTPLPDRTLAIVVSQSGESIDTVAAAEHLLRLGVAVIAITADESSPLADLDLQTALIPVQDELIGPKTKGYFATVLALQIFGYLVSSQEFTVNDDACFKALSEFIETADHWARELAPSLAEADVVMVLGQGSHVGTALEGSLKIAEMSGVPCFGLETEEASHGRLHGLSVRSKVIFIVSSDVELAFAQRLSTALSHFDISSYIVDVASNNKLSKNVSLAWQKHDDDFPLDVSAGVIPFQLLAEHMAHARKIVPEKMHYPTLGKYLGIKVSTAL